MIENHFASDRVVIFSNHLRYSGMPFSCSYLNYSMNTMNNNLTTVLNDLILINNDRVTGYRKAANELNGRGNDLWGLFQRIAEKSAQFAEDLRVELIRLGGQPVNGNTIGGRIYRGWTDLKNVFSGSDRVTILKSCEKGEAAAQQAYSTALEEDLTNGLRLLISSQKSSLKLAEDAIRRHTALERI